MGRMAVIGVVSAVVMVSASGSIGTGGRAVAKEQAGPRCTEATIRGTYGIQMQGTNPVPPPLGGGIQTSSAWWCGPMMATARSIRSTTSRALSPASCLTAPATEPYQVNDDCSGVTLFQPGPGITLEERMVIVDHGNEIRTIVSSPQAVMISTVQKRIHH